MSEASKPHLLMISTSFPDGEPGSEAAGVFVVDLAAELARHIRVTIVAPGRRAEVVHDQHGPALVKFRVDHLPLSTLNPLNPADWLNILGALRRGSAAVRAVAERDRPAHILALWALPSGHWARGVGRGMGIPYSIWALGADIWGLGRLPVIKGILRRVLRDARHRYADGYLLGEDVARAGGRDWAFLPSVRDLPAYPERQLRAAPPYRLGFLGRWHPAKGVDLLLDVLEALSEAEWDLIESVRIAGGGRLDSEVRSRSRALAGQGRPVRDEGFQGRAEAEALLRDTDFLLIPSRMESIPLVYSDAARMRCPVIASPAGDLRRLMDEHAAGLCATEISAEAYREVLSRALERGPASFSEGMRKAAAQFDIKTVARRLLSELELE